MLKQFRTNTTYSTRSICDHNCIFSVTVAKRTDKTMITDEGKRLKIHTYDGVEFVKPHGSYSMAAQIAATDDKEIKPDWFDSHVEVIGLSDENNAKLAAKLKSAVTKTGATR